jgi:hypothetical protein
MVVKKILTVLPKESVAVTYWPSVWPAGWLTD